MLIERETLCSLIPHSGNMCLLDGVIAWDEDHIHCISSSHLLPDNPLRRAGKLACVHLIEYGAQAMAVHGGLLARRAGSKMGPGYLASLHDVKLEEEYLDDIRQQMDVHAHKIAASSTSLMYQFSVSEGQRTLASARATVFHPPSGSTQ